MRSATTSSQAQALANPKDLSTHLRVSVDDGSGNYQDLTDLEGYNWVDSVTYEEASGKPVATAKVKLKREAHKLSLSPFMDGSKLNVGGTVIDIARKILIETAVLPRGKSPASNEWEEVFRGYIEKVALAKSPVVLSCQDLGAELLRRFIETQRVYAAAVSDNALNEVIQDIVDDNDLTNLATVAANFTWPAAGTGTPIVVAATGADTSELAVGDYFGYSRSPLLLVSAINPNVSVTVVNPAGRLSIAGTGAGSSIMIPAADRITLYIEGAAPAWSIHEYYQSKDRVLTALRKLAQQIGYEVSYRWNTGTSAFELTLWTPDRAAVTPDVTIGPGVFKNIQKFDQDRSKIRNAIKTTAMVAGIKTTVIRTDATSIAKYGRCYMEATEKSTSQINTVAELQDFGDIMLGDLKESEADLSGVMPYRWDIQPADYARFEADGTRFDTDQDMGIVSLKHTIPNTGEAKTVASVRGKPGGGVNRWLEIEGMPGVSPPIDHKSDAAPTGTASTAHVASIILEFDDPRTMSPAVDDWAYSRVFTHTADPGTGAGRLAYLVAVGRQTRFEIGGLLPGTLYHSRIEHVDEAGNVGNITADVQETTQMVGAYHEDPDSVKNNLIPNGDFGQATLPIATNPPDGWTADDTWGTDELAETGALLQQTGERSIKFPSGGDAVTGILGQLIPISLDVLYRFEWAIRASAKTAGQHQFNLGFRTYDKDKVYISSTNLQSSQVVGAINTWEMWDAISYVTVNPAAGTARYMAPYVRKIGPNAFDFYCDRYFMTQAMSSFASYRNAARNAAATAWTALACDAQVFDYGGINYGGTEYGFDAATGVFTCLQPGRYIFEAGGGLAAFANAKDVSIAFYLNGVLDKTCHTQQSGAAGNIRTAGTYTIDLVKGDFVAPYIYNGDVLRAFIVGATETFFTGSRIT